VSFCAAVAIAFSSSKERRLSRYFALSVFAILFLVFTILFGNAINHWDWNRPGGCYKTSLIAVKSASHPYVDKIYLSITACYMFAGLFCSAFSASPWAFQTLSKENVTIVAMVQYPVHLYSMIALRTSNAPLLKGDSENAWGFGQIVAVVTMFATLLECVRGIHSRLFVLL
jgi:hypothetical protein